MISPSSANSYSKLFHRNTTLDKVIHIISHWEKLYFVIVVLPILEIDFVPFRSRDDSTANCKYAVGNIENMIIAFYKPLDSLSMTNLGRFMSFNNVDDHVEKYFQKVDLSFR
jgi:hypothetical protein